MRYKTDQDLANEIKGMLGYDTTQTELASRFNISRSYLCDFLQGKRGAGPSILRALGYETIPFYRKDEK